MAPALCTGEEMVGSAEGALKVPVVAVDCALGRGACWSGGGTDE